jgi:hypothetical protein
LQFAELLFQLLVAHAMLDFILQPGVMASAKSRYSKFHTLGNDEFPAWYYWLGAHSLSHGGGVYLVTGNLWLGLLEMFLHGLIDHLKCERLTNLPQDQLLHLLCKLGYCGYLFY